jgi:putative endonuclease
LIVQKDNLLVAVEVKARSSTYFGDPQSFVSKKKIQLLVMAIDAFIQQRDLAVEVRFDIISYTLIRGEWRLKHLVDAFYPF